MQKQATAPPHIFNLQAQDSRNDRKLADEQEYVNRSSAETPNLMGPSDSIVDLSKASI